MKISALLTGVLLLAACSRSPHSSGPEQHYPLAGKVVALDRAAQSATIDAGAIPNFMDAMTMDYPVKSKAEFQSLRVGERITATVDVAQDHSYTLSNIKEQVPPK